MKLRKDQSNQLTVKYTSEPQKDENDEELFKRKEICEPYFVPPGTSFEERLLKFPPMEQNKFQKYAKFDGASYSSENKTIHVFIMPFPKEQRVYPITFTVQSKAKIEEFIGFILYGCYVQYPDTSKKVDFKEVSEYNLYISDETGEVDSDFPPLDNNEQIQKFHFSHLALGKRSTQSFQTRTFSVVSDSMTTSAKISLENDSEALNCLIVNNEAASSATDAFVDTLVYQAFRVNLISKRHFKSEVQLGISGEKIEIDPLQQKPSSYFFRSFKAIHYSLESVAWCEITSRKSNRFEFKIAHVPTSIDPMSHGMFSSFDDSMISSSLKVHSFETDPTTAEIICRKINRILDSKKTTVLREYFSRNDRTKRSFLRKRKFFL